MFGVKGLHMIKKTQKSSRKLATFFGVLAVLIVILCSWTFFRTKRVEADARPIESRTPVVSWLNGWAYRKSHRLVGAAGAATGYVVTVNVHRSAGTDSGTDVYLGDKCRPDFGDVRFTDNDGKTPLAYWLEQTSGNDATFRIKVTDNLSANQSVYVYYGRSLATSASKGSSVFPDLFVDVEPSVQTRPYVTFGTDGFVRNSGGLRIPEATYFDTRYGALHYAGWSHNRTYVVYANVNSDAMITYYDHDTGEVGTPVNLGSSYPRNDPHCNPRIAIDTDGLLYVFWGSHSTNQLMRRSVSPEDISVWENTKIMPGFYTYPQVFFLNNTLYWFYRNQWGGQWAYRTSTDYQLDWTWSEEHVVIDEPGTEVPYPIFMRGDESPNPSIHVAWNIYDGTKWRDVYYAYSDDGGVSWKKRDRTELALPLNEHNADVVYQFGFLHGWVDDLQLTPRFEPIITFFEADDGSVPYNVKIAKFDHGTWITRLVTDTPVSRFNLPVMRMEAGQTMKMYIPIGGDPNGNRPGTYGGEIQEFLSTDSGDTWKQSRNITANSPYLNNHVMIVRESDTGRPVANSDLQLVWSYGLAEPGKVFGWGPDLESVTEFAYNEPGHEPAQWSLNSDATLTVVPDGASGQGALFRQNQFSVVPGHAYHAVAPITSNSGNGLEARIKVTSNPAETFYYLTFFDVNQSRDAGPVVAFRNNGTIAYQDADGAWQSLQSYVQNTWYRLELFNLNLTNGTFDIAINGETIQMNCSFRTPASVLNRVGAGGDVGFPNTKVVSDNYLVRKRVSSEPGHGTWGSEETRWSSAASTD